MMGLFIDYLKKASSNAKAGLNKTVTLSEEEWEKEKADAQVKKEIYGCCSINRFVMTSLMICSINVSGCLGQIHRATCWNVEGGV